MRSGHALSLVSIDIACFLDSIAVSSNIFHTVWPLDSTSTCLVTEQCLIVFGRQTFSVWTGVKDIKLNKIILTTINIFELLSYISNGTY